jgi:hypothetical protein
MYKLSVSSEYLFVTWKFVYIIVQTKQIFLCLKEVAIVD